MVMARRPVDVGRRAPRRLPRLLLVAVGLSIVVLAVNSIVSTSKRGPDVAVAYADRVRPLIDRSTRQAAAVDDLRARAASLQATGLRRALERMVKESGDLVTSARAIDPPGGYDVAHGLLLTTLSTRREALTRVSDAMTADSAQPPEPSVDALVLAGRDLTVSDRAYLLFLGELPRVARKTMPASTWVPDDTKWGRPEAAALVSTVRAGASAVPVHDVALVTVTPTPAPVDAMPDGGPQVLPRSKTIRLDVVVANAGNAIDKHVAVEAVLTIEGGLDTARQFVDLQPGQRQTVALTLRPAAGTNASIRIKVGPVGGEEKVADNEQTITYVIR